MRVVVLVYLLASFCFVFGALIADGHKCIHGSHEIQEDIKAMAAHNTATRRSFSVQSGPTMESIRITLDFTNLDNAAQYCTAANQQRPDVTGGADITCVETDVLTAEKKAIIKERVMPAAVALIQDYLKVNRVLNGITPTNGVCGNKLLVNTTNVPNSDFHIIVSAGPLSAASREQTLAFASHCVTVDGSSTARPLIGKVNFNPFFLSWNGLNPSANDENLIQTAHHEIGHALGFSTTYLNAKSTAVNIRGKDTTIVRTPTVQARAQEFFGCADADVGVEVEDEGGSGSKGAHWDRRILFEELMTASAGSRMSEFTLAFFKDLGFYDVDFDKAIPLSLGKDGGCGFLKEKCDSEAGGKGKFWCLDAPSGSPAKSCTFDRRGIGYCNTQTYTSNVESYFKYFTDPKLGGIEFVDKCPYIAAYSNRECAFQRDYKGDTSTESAEKDLGFYFGSGGRCFDTSGIKRSLISTTDNLRCLQARCPYNGKRVEVKVGSDWLCCPLDGTARDDLAAPAEFSGTVKCPAAVDICDAGISFGSDAPETKPVGNTELPTNEGTSKLSAEVIFNGTAWENVIATDRQRVDLFNSIRMDIAALLRIRSSSITVRRSAIVENTIVPKGLSVLVGLIDDDQQAISSEVFVSALGDAINKDAPIPWTRDAYARANAGGDDQYTVIAGYMVEEKRSSSICSANITPDRCIMIIGICVTIGAALIVAILMYCLCFKSPFDIPPQPKGLALA